MDIKDLQKLQASMDEKYWDHEGDSDMENIRHVTLHLTKLIGKMATYCEAAEHDKNPSSDQIKNECIPDLLMHSLRLANILNVDVKELYDGRLEHIKKMFG